MSVTFKIDSKDFQMKLKSLEKLKSNNVAANVLYKAADAASESFTAVLKQETQVASLEAKGHKKYDSRNHARGTLRESVKKGLRRRVKNKNLFAASSYYQMEGKQYYANFVLHSHKPNAYGFTGGENFIEKAINRSETRILDKLGRDMLNNLTNALQKYINK
jgi:hypothetical protein